jgi:hypothetical protein
MRFSWRDIFTLALPLVLLLVLVTLLAFRLIRPAPPDSIRFVGGDPGGSLHRTATRYKEFIEKKYRVKVEISPSEGSVDTLKQLLDPKVPVDVGFVQGGLVEDIEVNNLVSLGSMLAQPMMVYYRGQETIDTLVQFKGKRIAVGPERSGTQALTMVLLKASNVDGTNTTLKPLEAADAVEALLAGTVDGAFFTGDTATGTMHRKLRESPEIRLMNFRQAEAYRRRFDFLARLTLPEGGRDFAKNWPPQPTDLIGPIVELVARDDLHPALSDLLVDAASHIHKDQAMFREANQYPQAIERDFPLSEDAIRYYKQGGKFFYKHLPSFWIASILDRLWVLLLPLLMIIVPATKVLPALYRWRVRSRIYRWYGALMAIEREVHKNPTPEARDKIYQRINEIQLAVDTLKTPVSFADQLYVLRAHVGMVRKRLEREATPTPT